VHQGIAKIADFGLAKRIPDNMEENTRWEYRERGTPAFYFPEQFSKRWNLDEPDWRVCGTYGSHSNIWQIGQVLYQLATLGAPVSHDPMMVEGIGLTYGEALAHTRYSDVLKSMIWNTMTEDWSQRPTLGRITSVAAIAVGILSAQELNYTGNMVQVEPRPPTAIPSIPEKAAPDKVSPQKVTPQKAARKRVNVTPKDRTKNFFDRAYIVEEHPNPDTRRIYEAPEFSFEFFVHIEDSSKTCDSPQQHKLAKCLCHRHIRMSATRTSTLRGMKRTLSVRVGVPIPLKRMRVAFIHPQNNRAPNAPKDGTLLNHAMSLKYHGVKVLTNLVVTDTKFE
jgi:serine/threonine protein kinase